MMNFPIRAITECIVVVIGVSLLTAYISAPVAAQSASQAIAVSPASAIISANPGDSVAKSFEVINTGTDTYTVKFSTAPYHVTGHNYDPHFTQLPGTLAVSDWIRLDTASVELKSNETVEIYYTIDVPSSTPPGGYYAVIFAETEGVTTGSGIVARKRIGNLMYITVNGEVKKSGSVNSVSTPPFSFSQTIPLAVRVLNDGGVHFLSDVSFSVTDVNGKVVFQEKKEHMILPSTEREVAAEWLVQAPIGLYTIQREATVADERVVLDPQQIIIISPWFAVFSLTSLLSVGVLFVLFIKKRKRNRLNS